MNPTSDDNLWEAAGVKSVSELPDFPFPNYVTFVTAVRNGDVSLGIEFAAARELVHVTKSPTAKYVLLALSWVPLLFVPASIIVVAFYAQWSALVGIAAALIGMSLASPYNPLRHMVLLASLASLVYCLIAGTILTAGTWSVFAFGLSVLAVRSINHAAWNWAHKAILRSEALTAYLWETANLHIKGKEFGMKTAARNCREKESNVGENTEPNNDVQDEVDRAVKEYFDQQTKK